MRNIILNENLDVKQVIPVLAEKYELDDRPIQPYGLDRLIQAMSEALPDSLQDTLQNVQILWYVKCFKTQLAGKFAENTCVLRLV